jgi:hypothetical protein
MCDESEDDLDQESDEGSKSAQADIKIDLDFINDISLKPH